MLRLSPYHHSSERSSSKFTPASFFLKLPCCSFFSFEYHASLRSVSLKELQVSLSFSLFNFQGSALIFVQLCSTSFPCELFYSITSALICQVLFQIFLRKFLGFWPLRVCDNHIILSHRVRFVKHFFWFFSKSFLPAFAPVAFQRQLFSLSWAAFCALPLPSLCDSVAILAHHSLIVKYFFRVFSVFFIE